MKREQRVHLLLGNENNLEPFSGFHLKCVIDAILIWKKQRRLSKSIDGIWKKVFLVGLEFELRTLHLQSRLSTAWATPPGHFAVDILEMGSLELFPQAGL
jgi:hypothetical protein